MNSDTKLSLEYDFYGALLTKRQSEVMQLYHEENLTLQEIGEELGISRQSAHDSLKSAERQLAGYEDKLGLVARFEKTGRGIAEIDRLIENMVSENKDNSVLVKKLTRIKKIIDDLEN